MESLMTTHSNALWLQFAISSNLQPNLHDSTHVKDNLWQFAIGFNLPKAIVN